MAKKAQKTKTPSTEQAQGAAMDMEQTEALKAQLVLTGKDIVAIGEEAELLVGGKNYNTAIISTIDGIRAVRMSPWIGLRRR
jgi:pyruvate,water dikinase